MCVCVGALAAKVCNNFCTLRTTSGNGAVGSRTAARILELKTQGANLLASLGFNTDGIAQIVQLLTLLIFVSPQHRDSGGEPQFLAQESCPCVVPIARWGETKALRRKKQSEETDDAALYGVTRGSRGHRQKA